MLPIGRSTYCATILQQHHYFSSGGRGAKLATIETNIFLLLKNQNVWRMKVEHYTAHFLTTAEKHSTCLSG